MFDNIQNTPSHSDAFFPKSVATTTVLPAWQELEVGVCCAESRTTFFNPEVTRLVRASNGVPVVLSDHAIQQIKAVYDIDKKPLLVVPSKPSIFSQFHTAGCNVVCQQVCGQCVKQSCSMCFDSCRRMARICNNLALACRTPHYSDSAFVRGIWFGQVGTTPKFPGYMAFMGPAGIIFCSDLTVDCFTGSGLDSYCPESLIEAFRRFTPNEVVRKRVYLKPEDIAMAPLYGFMTLEGTAELVAQAFQEQERVRVLMADKHHPSNAAAANDGVIKSQPSASSFGYAPLSDYEPPHLPGMGPGSAASSAGSRPHQDNFTNQVPQGGNSLQTKLVST